MAKMSILLVGTLDTKGAEIALVRDLLRAAGLETMVVDAGVLGPPRFAAEVPREQVFAAAGVKLAAIQQANDRGKAIEAAAKGVTEICRQLHAQGQVQGIIALGGSAGTTIG